MTFGPMEIYDVKIGSRSKVAWSCTWLEVDWFGGEVERRNGFRGGVRHISRRRSRMRLLEVCGATSGRGQFTLMGHVCIIFGYPFGLAKLG
ncbi:hypothetical protein ACLB2K_029918 [Fragaria x ananassa]